MAHFHANDGTIVVGIDVHVAITDVLAACPGEGCDVDVRFPYLDVCDLGGCCYWSTTSNSVIKFQFYDGDREKVVGCYLVF